EMTCRAVDAQLCWEPLRGDGSRVQRGDVLALVEGPTRSLLAAERTALNFLQHLSGVASTTRRYVDALDGLACRVLDTRKTCPGWRLLEKYAVRQGGGHNHRVGLFDAVLIKDNHLAALAQTAGPGQSPIALAVRSARDVAGPGVTVEIEVDGLAQL